MTWPLLVAALWLAGAFVPQPQSGPIPGLSVPAAMAQSSTVAGPVTGRPLPRFASLGSARVNARTGPGVEYPILWEYRRQNLPVQIVAESQNWRRIRDHQGDEGWVHHALLSGRRAVLVRDGGAVLVREPHDSAAALLRAEAGVLGELSGCDDQWCRVTLGGRQGYVSRALLWGVMEDE